MILLNRWQYFHCLQEVQISAFICIVSEEPASKSTRKWGKSIPSLPTYVISVIDTPKNMYAQRSLQKSWIQIKTNKWIENMWIITIEIKFVATKEIQRCKESLHLERKAKTFSPCSFWKHSSLWGNVEWKPQLRMQMTGLYGTESSSGFWHQPAMGFLAKAPA